MGQGSVTLTNYLFNSQCTTNKVGNVNDNQFNNNNLNDNRLNNSINNDNQYNNDASDDQPNDSNDSNEDDSNSDNTRLNSNYIEYNICTMNVQGLKKFEDDQYFLNFCRKYDIIGMCETWQRNEFDFRSFLEGYINFDCMRPTRGSAIRGSGVLPCLLGSIL